MFPEDFWGVLNRESSCFRVSATYQPVNVIEIGLTNLLLWGDGML